ncbi:MAG: uncharacterized protein KVP18_004236 [Porospora cf. gigantea A]|uniref:uncharacterized protein n=1 Tax=Porospora cf. gigantea A TaxID=2853593 RepID=UPI00355A2976|nr:MAG: hypothetical protein KVP18_004236 [Porospora cf. gigantea A]
MNFTLKALRDLHEPFLRSQDPFSLEFLFTEHLRMGGLFWTLGSLKLLGVQLPPGELEQSATETTPSVLPKPVTKHSWKEGIFEGPEEESATLSALLTAAQEFLESPPAATSAAPTHGTSSIVAALPTLDDEAQVLQWIFACYDRQSGGFRPNLNHHANLSATQYALHCLALLGALDDPRLDCTLTAKFVASLQRMDGCFMLDSDGESDNRFVLQAALSLKLLNRMDSIDVTSAVEWIRSSKNYDGGFGVIPGGESHAAYTYCCVCALALFGRLDIVDHDLLGGWLAQRQLTSCGGFNGRPEKSPDVCYSWWIYATLVILGRESWVSAEALLSFLQAAQDDSGGIADRPLNMPDVFHTFFGLAAMSLLKPELQLVPWDPVYCLPAHSK